MKCTVSQYLPLLFSNTQITRRYAEFLAALVSINQSHPEEQVCPVTSVFPHDSVPPCFCSPFSIPQVDRHLSSLQVEVENIVLRMAAEFPHRKEQLIFLINNYDMMLFVLSVSLRLSRLLVVTGVSPRMQERTSEESKESESFKGLLHARTQEFTEEVHSNSPPPPPPPSSSPFLLLLLLPFPTPYTSLCPSLG